MIHSMTGFGSGRSETTNLTVSVEIKSVNHRYLDAHIKLPGEFQSFEGVLRQKIGSVFKRGRVDVFVKIDYKRERVRLEINRTLIEAYVATMRELRRDLDLTGDVSVDTLARIPGLVSVAGGELTDEEVQVIERSLLQATETALGQLKAMRVAEGKALGQDLQRRLETIAGHAELIGRNANLFIDYYRKQLLDRITELAPGLALDSSRLETEALLYAERCDIAEETTRLKSHVDQFAALVAAGDEAGKRLDFILQEMNRESTTVLSKTSGLGDVGVTIGQAAVGIKVEIEKLREQVQNIE